MQLISEFELISLCTKIFISKGLLKEDAELCSKVLVDADLRGISSHGIAAFPRYIAGINEGLILPQNQPKIITEHANTLLVDACACMGMVSSNFVIQKLIAKAKTSGIAMGTVKNSNHFGTAAYYSSLGLTHNMLSLAMSNTAAIGVPTNGTVALLGTNAISFAAPANKTVIGAGEDRNKSLAVGSSPVGNLAVGGEELAVGDFVLDMATTVVPRGLIKQYADAGLTIPEGWAIDSEGNYLTDPAEVLRILARRTKAGKTGNSAASQTNNEQLHATQPTVGQHTAGQPSTEISHTAAQHTVAQSPSPQQNTGGIVPLGGKDETTGGHKGYGLSLMIDILTGILSGHGASYKIYDTEKAAGRSSHTFILMHIPHFRDLNEFKQEMTELLHTMISSPSLPNSRVQYHGQMQQERMAQQRANGIELPDEVLNMVKGLANKLD